MTMKPLIYFLQDKQFFQFALLTVVKLEVLVALDSNSRVGKGVLVKQTCCAILPLPQAQGAVPVHTLPKARLQWGHHSSSARSPNAVLAQVAPSALGHMRNPADWKGKQAPSPTPGNHRTVEGKAAHKPRAAAKGKLST
ncbi:hypothetical protein EK904_006094 [Melospiza melodia maxima]|nr:hypothetical protein EK904_006094 [Melospiza melodia maxima]